MTVVQETLDLPDGTAPSGVTVTIALARVPAGYTVEPATVMGELEVTPDEDGEWTADLVPNEDITPAGTVYRISVTGLGKNYQGRRYIEVPSSGPVEVQDILTDAPAAPGSSALAMEIAARIAADEDLDERLDVLEADDANDDASIAAVAASVTAEAATRAAADTALSDAIDDEATTRGNADTALDGRVDTLEATAASLPSTYVALTDYEDADVLAKVKNVDGTGSGLDADKLRNVTPSAYILGLLTAADALAARQTLVVPRMVAHGESTVTLVNSTTETDFITYSVPAGSLVAGDRLRVFAAFDKLNNTGGAVTLQPRVYIGATAILDGTAISDGSSTNRRRMVLDVVLTCVDGTNQRASGSIFASNVNSNSLIGVSTAQPTWIGGGVATENTSTAKNLKVSWQLGTASANADVRLNSYFIEKIPAGAE